MTGTPNTIFVLFAFPLIFLVCILWATHGHTSDADNEDLSTPGRDH